MHMCGYGTYAVQYGPIQKPVFVRYACMVRLISGPNSNVSHLVIRTLEKQLEEERLLRQQDLAEKARIEEEKLAGMLNLHC